jgi:hypothetical protein
MNITDQSYMVSPGFTVPSSEVNWILKSRCSIQPPGLVHLHDISLLYDGKQAKIGYENKKYLPESLLIEVGPGLYTSHQTTKMDKVKVAVRPSPLVMSIVDLKFYIWGNPGGLDRGEIRPSDGG